MNIQDHTSSACCIGVTTPNKLIQDGQVFVPKFTITQPLYVNLNFDNVCKITQTDNNHAV